MATEQLKNYLNINVAEQFTLNTYIGEYCGDGDLRNVEF